MRHVVAVLVCASVLFAARAAAQPAKKAKDIAAEVAALSSADLAAAAKAAADLGALDQPSAHDALLDALALGLPATVAIPAIGALALHPAPPDVASLRRYAGHRNPAVRSAALAGLAAYPSPEARTAIAAGLRDPNASVRAAAAGAAMRGRVIAAVDPLLQLLARSEDSAGKALAGMADLDLARKIGDHLGKVPDAALAKCLGAILLRADFGPDPARVEIVRAIAKIQDPAAVSALTDYVDATPKNPPRPSRTEAVGVVEARLGGGGK
jgi:HEAT repeat protein